jgi:hypothetical protein
VNKPVKTGIKIIASSPTEPRREISNVGKHPIYIQIGDDLPTKLMPGESIPIPIGPLRNAGEGELFLQLMSLPE